MPVFYARIKDSFSRLPKSSRVALISLGILIALGIIYMAIYPPAKSTNFTYANKTTCVSSFIPLPDLQKIESESFDVVVSEAVSAGTLRLAATKTCLEPKSSLSKGVATVRLSPFGSWFASQRFNIEVESPPVASKTELFERKISTIKPLTIELSSQDYLHNYSLHLEDKYTNCESRDSKLYCDIPRLDLEQGREYSAELKREYKKTSSTVVSGAVTTLQPVKLLDSSIKEGDTVYDKLSSVNLSFDQGVESVEAALVSKNSGEEAESSIKLSTSVEGSSVVIGFDELPRESDYELQLKEVTAVNGSSLADPISLAFKTSGGPGVKGVSVGSTMVSRSARIILTFDQAISKDANLAKFINVDGVPATVSRQSDDSVAVAINGGECQAFTISLKEGLPSAVNDGTSKSGWQHAARTVCGTYWSIGTSVKGRPIMAYSFGSGATTILFTGAIHGSEASAYTTLQAWVNQLQSQPVPSDKRIVIVPNANPDGVAAGTRYNSRNVNLGRNFPTANWSASIDTASGTLPTGGGTSAGSEPETAALMNLTRQLRPRLEVSFHSQGRLVGANKFGDSVDIGNVYAKAVGYSTMYYNAEEVMGYAMTGEYEDWMGESMGIPAILIELPSHSGNYLNSQLPALQKLLAL